MAAGREEIYDNHGRPIRYARISVTDRCNLRCFYCMPEKGIDHAPRKDLLQDAELLRLSRILTELGITKLRITGGEPFMRKGILQLIEKLNRLPLLQEIHLTTNGTHAAKWVPRFRDWGIRSVNLSLDTLDARRFEEITRRNFFPEVARTLETLLSTGMPTKINAVVMVGKNIEDILPLCELTRDYPVGVRFIEEMPFNGVANHYEELVWNHQMIAAYLQEHYPNLVKLEDPPASTASTYQIPGYSGSLGIIAAYSRTFCGTCNRIRITPQGMLKTCLYDHGVLQIRDRMRAGHKDDELKEALQTCFSQRAKDGWEAERNRSAHFPAIESMATIGG